MTPPPTTTTDRGGVTRQRILDVAAKHFLERGFAGTSLNDVIKDTKLTKGGFYFHFASKTELAVEVLDAVRDQWREAIFAAAGYHPRAVDQIAAMVRAAAKVKRGAPSGTAICRLCEELANLPGMADRIAPFDAWFSITAELFRSAQTQGDMDPAVDVDTAAMFAVCSYHGYDQLADVSGDDSLVERLADEYLAYTFKAVGITAPVPASLPAKQVKA
jgi:AcrR family transcriptional regulator